MLAAGLDPNAVKEAEKIGKEVQSKYATMSMAADHQRRGRRRQRAKQRR